MDSRVLLAAQSFGPEAALQGARTPRSARVRGKAQVASECGAPSAAAGAVQCYAGVSRRHNGADGAQLREGTAHSVGRAPP